MLQYFSFLMHQVKLNECLGWIFFIFKYICICIYVHVYVVYEDTNLYNDIGMT